MALMQDIAGESLTSEPSFGPRRSRRSAGGAQKNGNGTQASTNGDEGEVQDEKKAPSRRKAKESRPPGVDRAIDRLQQMEENLRTDVKRQKRALEHSSIVSTLQRDDSAFFTEPGGVKPDEDTIPVRNKKKKKTGAKEAEEQHNPQDEDDAKKVPDQKKCDVEDEQGDEEDMGDVDVATLKRDGARPPPVNSSYLPLPWKGRLGYVRGTSHTDTAELLC
jgi:UV DNA damage endonuclease